MEKAKKPRKRNRYTSARPDEMEIDHIFSPPIQVENHRPAIHYYVNGVIHVGCTCGWVSRLRSKVDPMRGWWKHVRGVTDVFVMNGKGEQHDQKTE